MMLDRYPLNKETDEGLIIRLTEECSEIIKACCKMYRFGSDGGRSPDLQGFRRTNIGDLLSEINDVELCIAELKKRMHEGQMDKMMKDLGAKS